MTIFLNFRSNGIGGSIVSPPYVLEGDGLAATIAVHTLGWSIPVERIVDHHIVFATHGFNVSYSAGVRSLARLEQELDLGPGFLYVGVLWPGDYWLPVVNYPAEAEDAVECGRALAAFANRDFRPARALSFVSHSLGGRLMLEAVKHLDRRAHELCLTAAAVDDDCMAHTQYEHARENADRVSVLASRKDLVLRLAFPAGDFVSDVMLGDDDSPWRMALGYHGPRPRGLPHVARSQIRPQERHGHLDYFPSSSGGLTPEVERSARFIRESILGLPHAWPHP